MRPEALTPRVRHSEGVLMDSEPDGELSADGSLLYCGDFSAALKASRAYAEASQQPVSIWPDGARWVVEVKSAPSPEPLGWPRPPTDEEIQRARDQRQRSLESYEPYPYWDSEIARVDPLY